MAQMPLRDTLHSTVRYVRSGGGREEGGGREGGEGREGGGREEGGG